MQNKKLIILGVLIVGVLVGGLIIFSNRSSGPTTPSTTKESTIQEIPASSIGLTLKPGSDNQRVVLAIAKTDGMQAIDYELDYTAKKDIPRGIIGKLDFVEGKSASKDLYLGTCSDVCHPDSDVKDIKIIVKVTKKDGTIYQSVATTSLP